MLEVKGLTRGTEIRDVSFSLHKGEILGFAGLMGAGRTEVARAIFGADKVDGGEVFIHGRKTRIRQPRDAVEAGIGYLSEDRKHFGLATGMDVRNNIAMASLSRFAGPGGLLSESAMHEDGRRLHRPAVDQDAIRQPGGQAPLRRQPAEDRHRQVAAAQLRRADLRRADARHRRRRQERRSTGCLNSLAAEGQGDHRHFIRTCPRYCGSATASPSCARAG